MWKRGVLRFITGLLQAFYEYKYTVEWNNCRNVQNVKIIIVKAQMFSETISWVEKPAENDFC